MKTLNRPTILNKLFILVLAFSFSVIMFAQDDTVTQDNTSKEKKEKKARSSFKVSAGVNFNDLIDSAAELESSMGAGYNLGVSYKRGRFLYWEIGARYNWRSFYMSQMENQTKDFLTVSNLDIPLTGGVNITSFADRLIGVRVFVSAIPSFSISKDVDKFNYLEDDDIADFIFYSQLGVGVDIAFFFVEVGYNYGFSNLIEDIKSNPSQGYLNIGFRF